MYYQYASSPKSQRTIILPHSRSFALFALLTLWKKLSMSNWGNRRLTPEQISYAARDAWVSAAIIELLHKKNADTFRAESLMSMEFMKSQRNMVDVDSRALERKKAKTELKAILEGDATTVENGDGNVEERKRTLNDILDLYRPDQPPTFSEATLELPLF